MDEKELAGREEGTSEAADGDSSRLDDSDIAAVEELEEVPDEDGV